MTPFASMKMALPGKKTFFPRKDHSSHSFVEIIGASSCISRHVLRQELGNSIELYVGGTLINCTCQGKTRTSCSRRLSRARTALKKKFHQTPKWKRTSERVSVTGRDSKCQQASVTGQIITTHHRFRNRKLYNCMTDGLHAQHLPLRNTKPYSWFSCDVTSPQNRLK